MPFFFGLILFSESLRSGRSIPSNLFILESIPSPADAIEGDRDWQFCLAACGELNGEAEIDLLSLSFPLSIEFLFIASLVFLCGSDGDLSSVSCGELDNSRAIYLDVFKVTKVVFAI